MKREEAVELLKKYVKNRNMFKHCLASEAVMRKIADILGEDKEKWAMAGLLHDIDIEIVNNDMKKHTLEAEKILKENGFPKDLIEAVKMHNETASGAKRTEKFHKALAASETITGLIVATTLVYPDKKLASVKTSSILKRMKDKRFAASVNRQIIKECEDIGIPLEKFAEAALAAMRQIAGDLGL